MLNKDIIQSFSQLKDIFPEILAFSHDTFFMFLNFGERADCLFHVNKLQDDVLALYIHCYEEDAVFLNFVKWFFWIFAVTKY